MVHYKTLSMDAGGPILQTITVLGWILADLRPDLNEIGPFLWGFPQYW
ncbi:hypothetical protein MICA_844 [Micavibrio aeruginosavorus ARL-13]|uniref:Uncharacterized protein n=1 Tax=Micavibrio aeruginosavorus (strain ARL-13) TaxID=856793 RepID=G2KRD0_MICAA|nr:hypothetical protein MICA_844 [Micavibrio aeruginosavorus ARL-13]